MLLDQDCPCEAQERGGVRERSDDIGAAFDLLVDPFQRVRGLNLPPVPLRERREREEIVAGLVEHDGDLRMRSTEHRGDLGELGVYVLSVGLREDRADDRGHHVLGYFRNDREHVAHEMHPAVLSARALEHGPDRFLQASSARWT